MIRIRVLDILKEKGKTKYWLYNQMNMSYQNFLRMVNNETKAIKYSNLELLCELLECNLNDLFEIKEDIKWLP